MRVAALALFIVAAAVSYCEAETDEAKTVEQWVEMANEAGAPFTEGALERLNNAEVWGAARDAGRAVDIVIINKSGKNLNPVDHQCSSGSLSPDLLAEDNLHGSTSTVLGVQSSEDDSDANIDCSMRFSVPESDAFFNIDVAHGNSTGDISFVTYGSEGIEIATVLAAFESNPIQVGIIVEDSDQVPSVGFRLKEAKVPQRKLKGSRNRFVKASKRGSSVRSM